MKETWKSLCKRMNNKGTILALVGLVVSLLIQFGFDIDSEKITGIVNTICTILITLGVLNDPTQNTNAYIPYVSDKLVGQENKNK